nr:hypothetical protein [Faecalicatena faecalis]
MEHDKDRISIADHVIDVGPLAGQNGGKNGGEVVFAGTPEEMLQNAKTLTADCLRASSIS